MSLRSTATSTTTAARRKFAQWQDTVQLPSHGCLCRWWSMSAARFTDGSTSPPYSRSCVPTLSSVNVGRLNANLHLWWPQNTACRFNDILIEKTSAHCPLSVYSVIRLAQQCKIYAYLYSQSTFMHNVYDS